MEYISIPWTNYRENEDVHNVEDWTVNLALFFMLVLAGNKHECDWKYGELKDEELKMCHQTPSQLNIAQGDQEAELDAEDITKTMARQSPDSIPGQQSPKSTPRQQSPSTTDTVEIFAARRDTPPKTVVRKSARLMQKATNQQIMVEERGESSVTGKRRRPEDSEIEFGPSYRSRKKSSKPSRDDYLTSFTGSVVDGFGDAQKALQVLVPQSHFYIGRRID